MYEDIIHANPNENLSIATGWLFLSIVLGSILTFTFLAAISTSFYCCQKAVKKHDNNTTDGIFNESKSQKLFFSNVPSTVYPTTQSILQQEDNEVIDSLIPAYRELPSAHFKYLSSFNGSITMDQTCCGYKHSTIVPNSTKSSLVHPHTTSISSEQLNIANDVANSELSNDDSNLSIRIASVTHDHQLCLTSATSGILTEGDLTTQTEEYSGRVLEPAINDQQLSGGPETTKKPCSAEVCGRNKNEPKNTVIAYDHSRGASTFGEIDLNLRNREFSPDYYALTFQREESVLSNDSGCSMRGASAFAPSDQRRSRQVILSPHYASKVEISKCQRGASAFTTDVVKSQQDICMMKETDGQQNNQRETLDYSHESLPNDKETKSSYCHYQNEPLTSSYHTEEIGLNPKELQSKSEILNARKAILEQQYIQESKNSPSCKDLSKLSASKTNTNFYKASFVGKDATRLGILCSQKDNGNNCNKNTTFTKLPVCLNSEETSRKREKHTSTSNYTTLNSRQKGTPSSPVSTLLYTTRDNTRSITTRQNTPRDSVEQIEIHDTKSIPTQYNLNNTYQSLRGASQLGDDDVCSGSDAFWDSISLSFAYESPSEEDVSS